MPSTWKRSSGEVLAGLGIADPYCLIVRAQAGTGALIARNPQKALGPAGETFFEQPNPCSSAKIL